MKTSKAHQRFFEKLNEPRALTNPEDFLGPNWKDVINFWFYIDGLSEEERRKIGESYWALDGDVLDSAWRAAYNASKDVVEFTVTIAACGASVCRSYGTYRAFFGYATYEVIGHHKLLEQGKSLLFLPLCLNP
jgi:hypothetical protein